ncbi:hypothetical protein GCM10027051_07690 [Niabella terrae]
MNEAFQERSFSVEASFNSSQRRLQVQTAETSDGIEFYKCSETDKDLTWLRKEMDQWKQIWGELNNEAIEAIGTAIDAELEQEKNEL